MLLILNYRPKDQKSLFLKMFTFLHLNQILFTIQTTLDSKATLCPTFNLIFNLHCSNLKSNKTDFKELQAEIFPKLCSFCWKPTGILNWSKNYNIKHSKIIRKRMPFLGYPTTQRKKRLLRNFPKPLHFKKGKEPRGIEQQFWKKFLMFSSA